MPVLISS